MNEPIELNTKELLGRLLVKFKNTTYFRSLTYEQKCEILKDTLIEMHGVKAIPFIKAKLPKLFDVLK